MLLQQLARYEDAYKRSLKFASFNMIDGIANLNSPFYELARLYKSKIKKTTRALVPLPALAITIARPVK